MDPQKYSYKPYEDIYPTLFKSEESRLRSGLSLTIKIDHFGSTAVQGLGGKGIIDIFITTSKAAIESVATILMEKLGYDFRPAGGDDRRLFFRRYQKDDNGICRTYHLHLTDMENPNYEQSMALRDYLRLHPDEAKRYDTMKKHASVLAMKSKDYEMQKKIYQETKSTLLKELNQKSLHWFKCTK